MKIRYRIFNLIVAVLLIAIVIGNVFAWFSAKDAELEITGASAGAYFAYGDGTKDKDGDGQIHGPYGITTPTHLFNLAWLQNTGKIDPETYFELGADITIEKGYVLPPIGNATNPFNSVFNGNGHTIDGLIVSTNKNVLHGNPADDNYEFSNAVGMFGMTGDGAEIKDFILINPTVEVVETNSKFSEVSSSDPKVFGLAVGHVADNVKVSTIGIVEGNLSVQRTNYATANNIIGDIAGGIDSSDFPTGNTQGSGAAGGIGYFIAKPLWDMANDTSSVNNTNIGKMNDTQYYFNANTWIVSSNGYPIDNGTGTYDTSRWTTEPTLNSKEHLGFGNFSFITGNSDGDMRIRNQQTISKFKFRSTLNITESGTNNFTSTIDGSTNFDGYITDKAGNKTEDTELRATFRYNNESSTVTLKGTSTKFIVSEDIAEFSGIGENVNAKTNYSTDTVLMNNALLFNITDEEASLFMVYANGSGYLRLRKAMTKNEIDIRIKLKAAKDLYPDDYASYKMLNLTQEQQETLLNDARLIKFDSRDFFIKNDYDILEGIDISDDSLVYERQSQSRSNSTGYADFLNLSTAEKGGPSDDRAGPGLYSLTSSTSQIEIYYINATGVSYGDDGGGGETPQEKLVTNVDFVDNEVTIVDSIFKNYTATGVRIYYESVSALYIYFNRTKDSFAVKYNNSKPTTTDDTKVTLSATTKTFEISETFDPATDLNRPF